ncbi:acyl carrier protein [Labilibacter sediminis]|nr:acyl carrier protein [Labilibacter sediminis]
MQTNLKRKIELRESIMLGVVEILITALQLKIEPNDLDPDTPLFGSGLGLDSVDAVVFIVELESRFNISISEEEGRQALRTVNSTIDLVIGKTKDND